VSEIQLLDPRHDPEPVAWSTYLRDSRLPALWAYDLVAVASRDAHSPAVLALLRDGSDVCGVLAAVVSGVSRVPPAAGPYPRVGFIDVRLPASRATPWQFAEGVDATARGRMLRAFERAAYDRFGPGIRAVCYRAAPAPDARALAGPGRLTRATVPNAELELAWASTDEWLATLSKSRRQDLRRQARIVRQDPDIRVQFGFRRDDIDPADLALLLRRHQQRLASRFGPRGPALSPAYFARVLARDDVGVLTYHSRDGRLLAFGTLFDNGDWPVIGWWAALDPEVGGRKHLYFDHYLRLMEWVIGKRRRGLTAGRGMFELKKSLGFAAVPMYAVAALRGFR
jgi:hypothetical protein